MRLLYIVKCCTCHAVLIAVCCLRALAAYEYMHRIIRNQTHQGGGQDRFPAVSLICLNAEIHCHTVLSGNTLAPPLLPSLLHVVSMVNSDY